ncbi:MAG: hypothetical protein ACHQAQ_06055 [Hyphomicrobiales bacterium]
MLGASIKSVTSSAGSRVEATRGPLTVSPSVQHVDANENRSNCKRHFPNVPIGHPSDDLIRKLGPLFGIMRQRASHAGHERRVRPRRAALAEIFARADPFCP